MRTSWALNLLFKYQYFRGRLPNSNNMPQIWHCVCNGEGIFSSIIRGCQRKTFPRDPTQENSMWSNIIIFYWTFIFSVQENVYFIFRKALVTKGENIHLKLQVHSNNAAFMLITLKEVQGLGSPSDWARKDYPSVSGGKLNPMALPTLSSRAQVASEGPGGGHPFRQTPSQWTRDGEKFLMQGEANTSLV